MDIPTLSWAQPKGQEASKFLITDQPDKYPHNSAYWWSKLVLMLQSKKLAAPVTEYVMDRQGKILNSSIYCPSIVTPGIMNRTGKIPLDQFADFARMLFVEYARELYPNNSPPTDGKEISPDLALAIQDNLDKIDIDKQYLPVLTTQIDDLVQSMKEISAMMDQHKSSHQMFDSEAIAQFRSRLISSMTLDNYNALANKLCAKIAYISAAAELLLTETDVKVLDSFSCQIDRTLAEIRSGIAEIDQIISWLNNFLDNLPPALNSTAVPMADGSILVMQSEDRNVEIIVSKCRADNDKNLPVGIVVDKQP